MLLMLFHTVSSQNNNQPKSSETRILSYQELLDEMVSCTDTLYELNNATVQYHVEKDKRFVTFRDSLAFTKLDTLKVKAGISLKNVSFKDYAAGNKSSDFTYLLFSKLEFEKEVSITNATIANFIAFSHSVFHSRFQITADKQSEDNAIYINESFFKSYTNIAVNNGRILISDSEFDPSNEKDVKYSGAAHEFQAHDEDAFIQLGRNRFCKNNDFDQTRISGELYALRCYQNIFETNFKISEMSIEDITMHDNQFQSLIDMTNVDF